jgi:hypothetical protein
MRTFPDFKAEERYDSYFLRFWSYAKHFTRDVTEEVDKYLERPILDQATPLVQSAHPSKIGNLP